MADQQKKEEVWAKRIQQCRDSGLSVQAWCTEHGLSYHTYYRWQQKLFPKVTPAMETGFYEVDVCNGDSSGSMAAVTVHIGAYSADVYNGADEQTVKFVLGALKKC